MRKYSHQILLGFFIFILTLVFSTAIGRSVWSDEAYSLNLAHENVTSIWSQAKNDNSPPLYYLILHFWTNFFGESEMAVRSLSLLFFFTSIYAVFVLGKYLFDRNTAFLSAFLFAGSHIAFSHALNVRMFSLLGLLVTFSTYLYYRFFFRKKTVSVAMILFFSLVNIAGMFTHYWFLFVILSQFISQLILSRSKSLPAFFLSTVLTVGFVSFILLPVFFIQAARSSVSWIGFPTIQTLLSALSGNMITRGPARIIWLILLAAVVLVRKKESLWTYLKKPFVFSLFLQFFLTILIPFLISFLKPIFLLRYTIISLPFVVLFLTAFLNKFSNLRFAFFLCIFPLIITVYLFLTDSSYSQIFNDRTSTSYIINRAKSGDVIIFTSISRPAIDFYFRRFAKERYFEEISFPYELELHPAWREKDAILRKRDLIENDAADIIKRISFPKYKGRKLFMFYGSEPNDNQVSDILKIKLDKSFTLLGRHPVPQGGSHYNEILDYQL